MLSDRYNEDRDFERALVALVNLTAKAISETVDLLGISVAMLTSRACYW